MSNAARGHIVLRTFHRHIVDTLPLATQVLQLRHTHAWVVVHECTVADPLVVATDVYSQLRTSRHRRVHTYFGGNHDGFHCLR